MTQPGLSKEKKKMGLSLREIASQITLNVLSDLFNIIDLGQFLRGSHTFKPRCLPVLAPGEHAATLQRVPKSSNSPALAVDYIYARAGTGTLGPLTLAAYPPAAGQYSIAPNGDIVVLTADAWTALDVAWRPLRTKLVTLLLPVVSNVLTIPAAYTAKGVAYLISANATTATAGGFKNVLAPGAAAPAAGQARLNLAKSTVTFAVADAVTYATVVLAVDPDVDMDAILSADSPIGGLTTS